MVLSMDRWKGKVAVVTGGGGGVGAAVVEELLDEGVKVVAVDLRTQFLDDLSKKLQNKKDNLYTFPLDISQEKEVVEFFKKITSDIGPVNILINCAGIIQQTNLTDGDFQKWKKVFDVNVMGLCLMTREAVKVMRDNEIDGHIVNICSLSGHGVPNLPDNNVYPASKHAVKALSETLRVEFNQLGLKIKITNLSPGAVSTRIATNNDFHFGGETKSLSGSLKTPTVSAFDIADGVLYALSTPPHVQVHQLTIRPVGGDL